MKVIKMRNMKRYLCAMKARSRGAIFCFLTFGVVLAMVPRPAHALLLLGSYVFMGSNEAASVMSVKNTANDPLAYRISWEQIYMNAEGGREILKEGEVPSGFMPADPYLYVSPRRVIIQGQQMQNIRFMARKPKDLPPGEYRSYVFLNPEKIPMVYEQDKAAAADNAKDGHAQAQLEMLTGYRIPVFFLNGETTLDVSFSDVHWGKKRDKDAILFTLNRAGNRSAIGAINVTCNPGAENQYFMASMDVKIFTELDRRSYAHAVKFPEHGCSKISLAFIPHSKDPAYNGQQPLAYAEIAGR